MSDDLGPCTPFFIVADIAASVEHYVDRLGFTCRFSSPDDEPIFAIVGRGAAQIMLKRIGDDVPPLANRQRHEWARWDTFIFTPEPDSLAREFAGRGTLFNGPVSNIDDDLRGFEVDDPDGYRCFFGCPIEPPEAPESA